MMVRKVMTLIAISAFCAVASSDNANAVKLGLDSIMSKAGISFGGEFRSQYFNGTISGPGRDSLKRTIESNEFTSVDFDIRARPNDNITGRCMFRMHQNWQNFYSDIANPIFTRWLSIDGHAADMFRFNVGDFRVKYSPLTMFTPEPDFLYEPYVFARQRQIAMNEAFIGNNDRVLQGFNFGFDAEIAPFFNEFHLGVSGARLRSNETNIINGSLVVNKWEKAEGLTKYYSGANLDLVFLPGIGIGATGLFIFDSKKSFRGSDTSADTIAQRTNIISGRPTIDIGKMLGSDLLGLTIGAEAAYSMDDSAWFDDSIGVADSVKIGKLFDTSISGMAVRACADVRYAPSAAWGVGLNAVFLMNDNLFRNELAQSPAFIPGRVMNLENDNYDSLQHYTTFDALYHTVFKFTPIDKSNRWAKAPFMKNSWMRTVFTQKELGDLAGSALDPSVQLVLPFGDATPNRQGITLRLKGAVLNNGIEATGLFSQLAEKDLLKSDTGINAIEIPATKFSQFGGGVKVDFSKLTDVFPYQFELSGSFVASAAKNDGKANRADAPKWEITSDFINAGLYYKFWKRAALIGGLQMVSNSAKADTMANDQKQTHWASGFEWGVAKGIDIVATYGQIIVKNEKTRDLMKGIFAVPTSKDFTQDLIDVSMRVRF